MSDMNERMRASISQIERLAAEAEAEAVSEGGAVRVVAGPGGAMKQLGLGRSALRLSGVELGETIVATLREATDLVERQLSADVTRLMESAQNDREHP